MLSVWALATFSILGIGLSRITSSQLALAKRVEERLVSRYAAEAAVQHALALRKADDTTPSGMTYDTLKEFTTPQEQELGRGGFRYTMVDENSRLPLNTTSPALQDMLSHVPGLDRDAAVAITDPEFRTKLDPTNPAAPFHVLEELLALEEVPPQMLEEARPFLTTYTTAPAAKVNINTAPPEVLDALGLGSFVNEILADRGGEGGEADTFFKTPDAIESWFVNHQGVGVPPPAGQVLLDVSSSAVTLEITTLFLGKPVSSYTIVIDPAQQKILRWSER